MQIPWAVARQLGRFVLWTVGIAVFTLLPPLLSPFLVVVASAVFVARDGCLNPRAERGAGHGSTPDAPQRRTLPWLISALAVIPLFAVTLVATYHEIVRVPERAPDIFDLYEQQPFGWVAVFLISIAFTPLVEEAVFRGRIQSLLIPRLGVSGALAITASLFALVHGDLWRFPYFFLLGVLFGAAVIAAEAVWFGVAIHSIFNATILIRERLPVDPVRLGFERDATFAAFGLALSSLLLILILRRIRAATESS